MGHLTAYPNSLRGALLAEAEQASDLAVERGSLGPFRSDAVRSGGPGDCVIRRKTACRV